MFGHEPLSAELFYIHDPMCSWCWAFRPVYGQIIRALPKEINFVRLLGGLAPDTDAPMPDDTREYVKNHWRTIQKKVPGTRFNFDFWELCQPRRATWPACRAVIAARNQGSAFDDAMNMAIQRAYYLQARNPSEPETLIQLAGEIGLDTSRFKQDLESPETMDTLQSEISTMHAMGVRGFPSLVIKINGQTFPVGIDYWNAHLITNYINKQLQTLLTA